MDFDCAYIPSTSPEQSHFKRKLASERRPVAISVAQKLEEWGRLRTSIGDRATQPQQGKRSYIVYVDGLSVNSHIEKIQPLSLHSNFTSKLNELKDSLNLSITQISDVFGVTRKSVYDWYEGAEPRSNITQRMEVLLDVLKAAPANVDLQRLKSVWHSKIAGNSFITILNSDGIDSNTLRAALLSKIHELYPRMASQNLQARPYAIKLGSSNIAEFDRSIDRG